MKRSSSSATKSKPLSQKRGTTAKSKPASKVAKPSSTKVASSPVASTSRKPASSPKLPVLDPAKSKQSQLIALLRATAGASMAAMTSLTGWQPHTVRGTISGSLRKRLGLNVQCLSEDGVRVYRIVEVSAP